MSGCALMATLPARSVTFGKSRCGSAILCPVRGAHHHHRPSTARPRRGVRQERHGRQRPSAQQCRVVRSGVIVQQPQTALLQADDRHGPPRASRRRDRFQDYRSCAVAGGLWRWRGKRRWVESGCQVRLIHAAHLPRRAPRGGPAVAFRRCLRPVASALPSFGYAEQRVQAGGIDEPAPANSGHTEPSGRPVAVQSAAGQSAYRCGIVERIGQRIHAGQRASVSGRRPLRQATSWCSLVVLGPTCVGTRQSYAHLAPTIMRYFSPLIVPASQPHHPMSGLRRSSAPMALAGVGRR